MERTDLLCDLVALLLSPVIRLKLLRFLTSSRFIP
nr:MAG TPA: hypothetical protein [Caudoviricetes sp.]